MATVEEDLDREMAGIRPVGRGRVLARILGAIALVLLVPVLVLFVAANGVTGSSLALGALLAATGLVTMVRVPARGSRRVALLATATLCLLGVSTFVMARLCVAPPPQQLHFVEDGHRDVSPPWLSQLVDERETAMAGLYLSSTLGLIGGRERDHLEQLLTDAYPASYRPWPNAALIESSPGAARHLEHVPGTSRSVPCIVFLHGFGGQLTAYLQVLYRAFGDRFAIVAPFLDSTGAFWAPRGMDVVRETVLKNLPPEVDRTRVFLVGLSNGAIGATAVLQEPELSRQFRGFVLVSGIGEVGSPGRGRKVLLITGADDPRFPLDHIQRAAATLREGGAEVKMETFQADHFLWLSHAREMTSTIDDWLAAQLRE